MVEAFKNQFASTGQILVQEHAPTDNEPQSYLKLTAESFSHERGEIDWCSGFN